jgi:hypothetical protein
MDIGMRRMIKYVDNTQISDGCIRELYCARYDFAHWIGRSKIQKFKDARGSGKNAASADVHVCPACSIKREGSPEESIVENAWYNEWNLSFTWENGVAWLYETCIVVE